MGHWAVNQPKDKGVVSSKGYGKDMAEAEAKLYQYIEALEKQIERLGKERASGGPPKGKK